MKWRINWWMHNGRIRRGHDIIEGSENFTKDDAEELLEKEAHADGKLGLLNNFGFYHSKSIMELGFVSNFGVLSVRNIKREDTLCKGIDPNRPIPYDEIVEAREGRIGADRTDYILIPYEKVSDSP